MAIEDDYADVLQNIEFAIVTVYRQRRDVRDYDVMRALDALIEHYRAESRGHPPKQLNLLEKEALLFQLTQEMCEFRLGRKGMGPKDAMLPPMSITVDEILTCLRKIRRSVDKWNRQGGAQGYLKFVDQFIK